MTIIITAFDPFGNLHIVSDNAELTNGEISPVKKVYVDEKKTFTWGVAGYPPSRAMLNSTTVDDLWAATQEWQLANVMNQIVIVEFARDGKPLMVWTSFSEKGDRSALVEVGQYEVAIGAFAQIWPSFKRSLQRKEPHISNWEAATRFAGIVNVTSGLNVGCDSDPIGSVPSEE